MKKKLDDDAEEVRLFSEIIELTPERQKRLIEALQAYHIFLANADEILSARTSQSRTANPGH